MGYSRQPDLEELFTLAPHLEIAHHIPGRIRLRIRLTGLSALSRVDLQDIASAIPGIHSVRVNAAARSAVIEYDSTQISPDTWNKLGQLGSNPELKQEIVDRLISLTP